MSLAPANRSMVRTCKLLAVKAKMLSSFLLWHARTRCIFTVTTEMKQLLGKISPKPSSWTFCQRFLWRPNCFNYASLNKSYKSEPIKQTDCSKFLSANEQLPTVLQNRALAWKNIIITASTLAQQGPLAFPKTSVYVTLPIAKMWNPSSNDCLNSFS